MKTKTTRRKRGAVAGHLPLAVVAVVAIIAIAGYVYGGSLLQSGQNQAYGMGSTHASMMNSGSGSGSGIVSACNQMMRGLNVSNATINAMDQMMSGTMMSGTNLSGMQSMMQGN